MDKDDFDEFLSIHYDVALEHYHKRALYNQKYYRYLQWAMVILSMLTAILVGFLSYFDWIVLKLCAAICSVVASSLATALKTFNFQEKWSSYMKIYDDLKNEYARYKANLGSYTKADDKESHFIQCVTTMLSEYTKKMPYATVPPSHLSRYKRHSKEVLNANANR